MKKVNAVFDWSLDITCPDCKEVIDLTDDEDYTRARC